MYATSRQFIAKAQEEGNPAVIDLICYLHPTHIAFKKAVQVLNNDVLAYLVNLHSFFKHSTARREDRNLVQERCAEEMEDNFAEELDQLQVF